MRSSSSLHKTLSALAAVALSSIATSPAALLYDLTFENGSSQSLQNTGTVGGTAVNIVTAGNSAGVYTSDVPPVAGNNWAYDLPSSGTNGSYLDLPDATQLRLSTAGSSLTVAMWIKLDNLVHNRPIGLVGNFVSATSSTGWGFWIQDSSTGASAMKLAFSGTLSGGASYTRTSSGTATVPLDLWTHVAVTLDGSAALSQNLTFYINGVAVGTGGTNYAQAAQSNSDAIRVGKYRSDYGPINGSMDDVMIYDTALTAAQIASLATPIPEPSVVGMILLGCTLVGLCRRSRA